MKMLENARYFWIPRMDPSYGENPGGEEPTEIADCSSKVEKPGWGQIIQDLIKLRRRKPKQREDPDKWWRMKPEGRNLI